VLSISPYPLFLRSTRILTREISQKTQSESPALEYFDICSITFQRGTSQAGQKLSAEKEEQLRLLANEAGFELKDEVRIHRFDSPFKSGFM